MQQQQKSRLRGFVQTPVGKALLIALALLVTFASYVYVETLVAIPAMLLFGLALPIWAGIKAPRYLALSGLVILLLIAPLSNLVITQDIMTPIPASSSANTLPSGNGGSVLQNALVTPYVGGAEKNFTWTVTVFPQVHPGGQFQPSLVESVHFRRRPGATGNNSPSCSASYPFFELNDTAIVGITSETNVTFHYQVGSDGIWDWQMSLLLSRQYDARPQLHLPRGRPHVQRDRGTRCGKATPRMSESLLLTLYFDDFLFLEAPFYFVLLIYMILKRRERSN